MNENAYQYFELVKYPLRQKGPTTNQPNWKFWHLLIKNKIKTLHTDMKMCSTSSASATFKWRALSVLPRCWRASLRQFVLRHLMQPVLNWANVCSPEHTSDTSTNYDSFFNWTFSSPNMVRTVQTLLHSQLAWDASFGPNLRHWDGAADSMIENVG